MKRFAEYIHIGALSIVVLGAYSCESQPHENPQNREYCIDLVQILNTVYSARGNDASNIYENSQTFRQSVENAQLILEPWLTDADPTRKESTRLLQSGLENLERAIGILLDLDESQIDEKMAAEFSVRLDDGRRKFLEAALVIMHPDTGLRLSNADRAQITFYTKKFFADQIVELSANLASGNPTSAPSEVWAAGVITGDIDLIQMARESDNQSSELLTPPAPLRTR